MGYQNYNGMLLSSRLDIGTYLNLNANYTLSKCDGVADRRRAERRRQPPCTSRIQNNGPADITLDEGPCPADRRHLFNLTSVFRTPEFTDGVLGALASDWTASSVLQVRSGGPVNVVAGGDTALNGFTDNAPTQRPNLVSGVDPYGDRDALTGYFNIAAFSQPAPGTLGDAPFNLLRGPGFWQWDQSFVRGVHARYGHRIELRAEAINLTNQFNRGNPAASAEQPSDFRPHHLVGRHAAHLAVCDQVRVLIQIDDVTIANGRCRSEQHHVQSTARITRAG